MKDKANNSNAETTLATGVTIEESNKVKCYNEKIDKYSEIKKSCSSNPNPYVSCETIAAEQALKAYQTCCQNNTGDLTCKTSGKTIYFDPEKNAICSNPKSSSGTKTGCMKWYVLYDDDLSNTIDVILDHNTSENILAVQFNNVVKNFNNVRNALSNDITTWNNNIKSTARLARVDDIRNVVGYKGLFGGTNYLTLDSFKWLSDNLSECYFLDVSGERIYDISSNGVHSTSTDNYPYDVTYECGIRPVITLPRSIIN